MVKAYEGVKIQAILSFIIGTLGLLGNFYLLARLLKKSQQFYILVKTLVCFDVLFIGLSIAIQVDNFIDVGFEAEKWLYPCIHVAMVGTIYVTILMSFERFWMLTKCHTVKPLMFWFLYLATIMFTILFNIPKFLEFNVNIGSDILGLVPLYKKIYTTWIELIFTCFVPIIALLVLNGMVLNKISKVERGMCAKQDDDEQELIFATKFNILIVLWFVVGHFSRWILDFYQLYHGEMRADKFTPTWIQNCVYASNVLLTLRSSVNFYVYVMLK